MQAPVDPMRWPHPTVDDLGRCLVLGHHIGLQCASDGKVKVSCAAAAAQPARPDGPQPAAPLPSRAVPSQDRLPAGRCRSLRVPEWTVSSPPLAMPCAGAVIGHSQAPMASSFPGHPHMEQLAFDRVSSVRLWSSPYSDMVAGAEWEGAGRQAGGGAVLGVGKAGNFPVP